MRTRISRIRIRIRKIYTSTVIEWDDDKISACTPGDSIQSNKDK
jgi:hypothetical protein